MDSWLLKTTFLLISLISSCAFAQAKRGLAFNHLSTQWWRNGSQLDLDFTTQKFYYNGTSYSGLTSFLTAISGTYSRASTATYTNSSGTLVTAASGVPRYDYDPITHAPRGIYLESASTNLALNSEHLESWSMLNGTPSVTADTTVAPDGNTTADTLTNTGGVQSSFYQSIATTVASGGYVTFSAYVKQNTGFCAISWGGASQVTGGTVASANVGNGWYRYTLTGTATVANATAVPVIYANANSSCYAWGAQLEQTTAATSYIATTSSSASRAQDAIMIPTASWLNANAGTLIVYQDYTVGASTYDPIIGVSEGDSFGAHYQGVNGTNICLYVDWSCAIPTGALAANGIVKTASSYSATKTQISRAGATAIAGAAKTLTTATKLYIGRDFNGVGGGEKRLRRMTYFNQEMSAASLADFSR